MQMMHDKKTGMMPADLVAAQECAYQPSGFTVEKFVGKHESQEYGACKFEVNNKRVEFRVAKITPTKIGQFVTIWKRIGNGPIMPYDIADPVDLFVISVRYGERFGQFVFPKNILQYHDFVSSAGNGGKRAMRIYPPWDIAESILAKNTQRWQQPYFFEIFSDKRIDSAQMQRLFASTR